MPNWKEQLSKAWGDQDLSKDAYDYDKYYKDQPVAAWMQLRDIEANKWNPYITSAHFPDGGKSGLYKTSQHPTYPGLGNKSWSPDGSVYYLSDQQYMNPKDYHNIDNTLDYLGSDYSYNKGGTHVVYKGANVLPTLWVLPKDRGFNLRSNKYDNGFEYKDRKQDIKIPYKQRGGEITPEEMQKRIDKKHPQYAWIRDHDKPLENIYPEYTLLSFLTGAKALSIPRLKESWIPIRNVFAKKKKIIVSKEIRTPKEGVMTILDQIKGIVF